MRQSISKIITRIITLSLFILSQVSAEDRGVAAAMTGEEEEGAGWLLPNGIWNFRGYGYTLQVVDGVPTLLDETETTCIPAIQMLLMGIHNVDVTGDVAKVYVYRFVPYFVLDRSDSFQRGCKNGVSPIIGDPDYVRDALVDFDILSTTLTEHFAHFENRLDGGRPEWNTRTIQARATLTSDSSDDELVEAFESMLMPLDDYHTSVKDENETMLVWAHPYLGHFEDEFNSQNRIDDWETYAEEKIFDPWLKNAAGYMAEGLKMESSGLAWGHFKDDMLDICH